MPPTRTRQAGLVLWPILWQCGRSPIPERIDRGLERVAGMWGGALQDFAMMSCRTTCPERSRGKWGISMRGRPPSARWRFVARRARNNSNNRFDLHSAVSSKRGFSTKVSRLYCVWGGAAVETVGGEGRFVGHTITKNQARAGPPRLGNAKGVRIGQAHSKAIYPELAFRRRLAHFRRPSQLPNRVGSPTAGSRHVASSNQG